MFLILKEDIVLLTFNIIIINRNKTAIAPTYIITKVTPKNSELNTNKMIPDIQNIKIKEIIDSTGLPDNTTKSPDNSKKTQSKICKFSMLNLLGITGFELVTSCSQNRRATNCAIFRNVMEVGLEPTTFGL